MTMTAELAEDATPHRWAINEDPAAPSRHETSTGRPDHCLVCGVVRYPLTQWAADIAAGPCEGQPLRRRPDAEED